MVKLVPITFHKVDVFSQELGSTDEHLVSRVHGEMVLPGERAQRFTVNVKQVVGSTFDREHLEVMDAPRVLDAGAIRREVADYYLGCISTSTGAAIRVTGGALVKLRNCSIGVPVTVSVPLAERSGGW
jgi:ribosomal protein S10